LILKLKFIKPSPLSKLEERSINCKIQSAFDERTRAWRKPVERWLAVMKKGLRLKHSEC